METLTVSTLGTVSLSLSLTRNRNELPTNPSNKPHLQNRIRIHTHHPLSLLCQTLPLCSFLSLFHSIPKALGWEISVTHPPFTAATKFVQQHHHQQPAASPHGAAHPVAAPAAALPVYRDEFYRTEQPPWHRMVAHPPHWIVQPGAGSQQGRNSASAAATTPGANAGGFGGFGGNFGRLVRTMVRTTEPYGRIVQFF